MSAVAVVDARPHPDRPEQLERRVVRVELELAIAPAENLTLGLNYTRTDSYFIVNSRLAIADLPLERVGGTAELSLWARNLLDEKYLFYKSANATLGNVGIFNEPRTYGVEARIRF